ncbi:MAG: M15 family metallopeptidase, partial [Xanthomonadales bacterium]|nr:M15 family metallopeptidase [Xanthomonadales bacterium]
RDEIERLRAASHREGLCATRADASLRHRLRDRTLLVAERRGRLAGVVGLDLGSGELLGPWVAAGAARGRLPGRLVEEAERLAAQFGLFRLSARPPDGGGRFWTRHGYARKDTRGRAANGARFEREFPQRQTRVGRRIEKLLEELGIRADYGVHHRLCLQAECRELQTIGTDIHGREQWMHPDAAQAWLAMRDVASGDGVTLQAVSAFRTHDYQAAIVRNKLARGTPLERILAVSAAPGYSEHHSGRALDITTPGTTALEEEFEGSEAFEWLGENAAEFGFRLSYPRGNHHRVAYEPWHWYWTG